MNEYGAFETREYAHCLAARLHDQFSLDLGDGDYISVHDADGSTVVRRRSKSAEFGPDEIPF